MKWASDATLDGALNHLRNIVIGYHITVDPVLVYGDLAAASIASGPVDLSVPETIENGRRITVTCQPTALTAPLQVVPLHLCLVSEDSVEYVTSVPAPAAPAEVGGVLNVNQFTIQFDRGS